MDQEQMRRCAFVAVLPFLGCGGALDLPSADGDVPFDAASVDATKAPDAAVATEGPGEADRDVAVDRIATDASQVLDTGLADAGDASCPGLAAGLVTLSANRPGPYAIAVGDGSVFWAEPGAIMTADIDGCTTAVLATLQDQPTGIALWGANVFWVDNSGSSTNEGSVMRAPAAGGSPTTLAGSLTAPWALTTNGVNIFFTQDISPLGPDDAIWEIGNDAGADAGPTAIASGLTGPGGIATDGVSLYWTNAGGYQPPGTVTSMLIAGGPVQTIASGQSYPTYIATDGVNVYWTDSLESGGTVMKWSIAGGGPPVVLADNQVNPYGIATDGVSVYWTDLGDWIDTSDPVGMVMKVPVGGGTPTTLASSQARPALIAVDATSVYWTNEGTTSLGSVMKLTPK